MAEEVEESENPMRRRETRIRQTAELSANVTGAPGASPDPASAEGLVDPTAGVLPELPPGSSPEEAVEHWRELVMRDPGSSAARRRLARALEARGEPVLAVEQLESARNAQPDDIALVVELAQAQIGLRRFEAAERELRRALKIEPENADVHQSLGVISLRRGLYPQAEQELKRALELDPSSGASYLYRAEALNQLSRVDEALALLERATQLDPSNGRAFYLMGILYDKKGRPQEAGTMYRRAREVGGA